MKLYVREASPEQLDMLKEIPMVDDYEDSDTLLILPGGLESLYNLLRGIDDRKDIYLFNENFFFSKLLRRFYKMYEEGRKKEIPNEYLTIEQDFEEIVRKMEEKKNEKLNDGKTSQLL